MDNFVKHLARELADTIADAVIADQGVEECREKARAAGYEMHISLEAEIGFASQADLSEPRSNKENHGLTVRHTLEMDANDRRFLRSLRIAADEPAEGVK
jgi:hypothetical protein